MFPQAGSSMLMELRKASNHHLLHRRIFNDKIIRQMAKIIIKVANDHNGTLLLHLYPSCRGVITLICASSYRMLEFDVFYLNDV